MTTESVAFTNAAIAKICHDLAAPINALSLGLDMLFDAMPQASKDPQMVGLLTHSANNAKCRLKLYRQLFSHPEGINLGEVKKLLDEAAHENKIKIFWQLTTDVTLDGMCGLLLLGTVMVAFESLPRGGDLHVQVIATTADFSISVYVEGDMAQLRPGYEDVFCNTSEASLSSRTLLPMHLRNQAQICHKRVVYQLKDAHKFFISICS